MLIGAHKKEGERVKQSDTNTEVFFALLRAGLWERDIQLGALGAIDYAEIFRIALEQSVVGLIAAGLEHVTDVKIPQDVALSFAGAALQIEQRNVAMNSFLGELVDKMRAEGIYALLLKGQGIAQCYDRPLWRASGDMDFLLSNDNYIKAKAFLSSLATRVENENPHTLHLALQIQNWEVELHGNLRNGLWRKMDKALDKVQYSLFYEGKVRSWMNGRTQVFLPGWDEDVTYVFAHILQHFYKEGIGLRQICDWCRLLWTFKDDIDSGLLKFRLFAMGCESEWKSFAAFAVNYLGMPSVAMPLYSSEGKWHKKAEYIADYVLKVGNFGHNQGIEGYKGSSVFRRKLDTMKRGAGYAMRHFYIFPAHSLESFGYMLKLGISKVFGNYRIKEI